MGDIVDGWQLRRRWYWPQAHNDVVQKLLRRARKGCRVVFVPGNHDEFARQFAGHSFGGIEVAEEAVHVTADGQQLWVIHGDCLRRRDPVRQVAGPRGRHAVRVHPAAEPPPQPPARPPGPAVLVAVGLPQAQGQEGAELRDRLRAGRGPRGAPARPPGRGLRPHPPRRDARDRRRPLLQRRRLGGKPHRAGGALRRPPGTGALGAGRTHPAASATATLRR